MNTNKEKILIHYENSINLVKNLVDLSGMQWRTQIDKDKWTIAEVIGHLIPWDAFVLNQRIPYLFEEIELPKSPNTKEINNQASKDSRKLSKEEIIGKFIVSRRNLINAINNLADELWFEDFIIGKSSLTLFSYFSGLVEHDEHHFMQIQKVLRKGPLKLAPHD